MQRLITLVLCSFATAGLGQGLPPPSFSFLNAPAHARLAALGGVNVSHADRDVNFFHNNPALAGDTVNGTASAGYQFYVGDIGNALLTFAYGSKRTGQIIIGVQHMNYGSFQGFDETGAQTTMLNAGETAVLVGRTHGIGNFRLGLSLKGVFSNIAGYRATAVLMDAGGIFKHPNEDLTVGLVLKNMGFLLSDYTRREEGTVPFDVQAGVTFKPEHMPLRFSFTAHQLVHSDLLPPDDGTGDRSSAIKQVFNRLNFGAEILLHRNVEVLAGYNYLLHQSLKTASGGLGAGICFGFSLTVKPVEFVFSRNSYTVGNAGYSFTLLSNINQLLRKQ